MLDALKIFPAQLGGFVVLRDVEPGYLNVPLFAGSLPDCLETIRAQLSKPVGETKEREA